MIDLFASGVSTARFLPSDPNKRCDRLKLLLQEKQGSINSDLTIEEIIDIIEKLLEYCCLSKKL